MAYALSWSAPSARRICRTARFGPQSLGRTVRVRRFQETSTARRGEDHWQGGLLLMLRSRIVYVTLVARTLTVAVHVRVP